MIRTVYRRWSDLSLSARILTGLALGLFVGLFFGEPAAVLQPAADIYIRLMQMTVLPYLITSVIIAFGQLEVAKAKQLAWRAGMLLFFIWGVTGLVLVIMPFVFPAFENAQFFSDALVEPPNNVSLTDIYFSSNPFASLSNNVVPASVLFASLVGIGLIGMPNREHLLDPLRAWNGAIVRITEFVIALTPYGTFAIGAVAAGTMDLQTLAQLQVYLVLFSSAALLLCFWILPLLVTAVTPFRYREVTGIARDALLTAFIANSAFIVMPILMERCKQLMTDHGLLDENSESAAEVLIPIMFNFPNAGKLLTLLFIPFAAWLSGAALEFADYPKLLSVGIPSYFAKAQVALPFLLDVFGLPHDLFQLYIPTTILTGKFDSLVTAMNLVVFALLGAGAMGGFLIFDRTRLLRAAALILGGTVALALVLRITFSLVIDTTYHMAEEVREMPPRSLAAEALVHSETAPIGPGAPLTVTQLRERGSLRIGFDPDNLPMSFFNSDGDLVGFDVELGEMLANALGLRAEFVPITWPELPRMLADGAIDIMPGMWYRPYWFDSLRLTKPYFIGTVGLAVRDKRRHEFDQIDKIESAGHLQIGVPLDTTQISYSMQHYFGGADVEFVPIEFWKPFFEGHYPEVDAFILPAEHASAWTLLHPDYTVVVPQPNPVRIPSAFGVALTAQDLTDLVNEWIVYAENAGTIDRSFQYWVRGQGAEEKTPRWSIARDVLGWLD